MARPNFLKPVAAAPATGFSLVNDARGVVAPRIEAALDSASRRRGLLGRTGLPEDVAFVIAPSNAIHTFSMRFPIDVLFVSRSGEVLKRVVAMRKGRISLSLRAFAVIEFCANHPGVAATKVGDRVRVEPIQS